MIDESRTIEIYGYMSDELTRSSHRRVVAVCEDCGKYRDVRFYAYRDLCHPCSNGGCYYSDERRKRTSEVCTGRRHSEETKKKLSEINIGHPVSEETKQKIGEVHIGKRLSEEHRQKMSAAHQGIQYDEWESYSCDSPYCPRFNNACRESNREKYGRKCFICGLPESENISKNGKQIKLSVHHVDMQKSQGCDGVRWKLVPICMNHHRQVHNKLWMSRIEYLLNHVW